MLTNFINNSLNFAIFYLFPILKCMYVCVTLWDAMTKGLLNCNSKFQEFDHEIKITDPNN